MSIIIIIIIIIIIVIIIIDSITDLKLYRLLSGCQRLRRPKRYILQDQIKLLVSSILLSNKLEG